MDLKSSQISAATDAVRTLLRFEHPADSVLRGWFRDHPAMGARDRAFIAETAFGVLRHLRRLQHLAPDRAPRKLVLGWLAIVQKRALRSMEDLLSREEAAWLGSVKADQETLPPAVAMSLPDWIYDRLAARFPEEELAVLGRAMLEQAPLDLRANTLLTKREDALAALRASEIEARPCSLAPAGIRLKDKPQLEKHALFVGGHVEVQDEGSQLVAMLVDARRGQMVVDFCAGAGGKTLAIGALMHSAGRLYAFDTSERRLTNLKPRLKRSGLSNVHPQLIDSENDIRVKRLAGKIDRVLVDAPCSGTGTLRRNPDIKWRQQETAIAELSAKQRSILSAAARLPKIGGRLVYATCSLLVEENEAVVEAFLAERPNWKLIDGAEMLRQAGVPFAETGPYVHLLPHRDDTDGFFVAVLERTA